jgi:hypothetical protein
MVCYNDSVKLSLPVYDKYLWNNNDTHQYIYVKKQGIYSATAWNGFNCFAKSVNVTVSILAPYNASIKQSANKDTLYIVANRKAASYLWLKDAATFAGNANAIIIKPTAGKYTATVTDSNGCVAKTGFVMVVNGVSKINTSPIELFPNPTTNIIYISGLPAGNNYIQVFDINGKTIYTKNIYTTTHQLATEAWPAGVYILKSSNGNGLSVVRFEVVR